MNKTSSIGSAAITLTIFGLIGKATGFFREVLFANYFGISREYEFYLVASVFPITLNSIALYIYQNYFIPAYSKRENFGTEYAVIFSRKTFLNSVFVAIVSCLLLILLRNPILKVYLGDELISYKTELLFIVFSCTVPLSIISGFLIAYLQTQFKFKSPAMAALSLNIFTIVFLIIFKETNIIYIALSYLLGTIVQMIILLRVSHILSLFRIKYSIDQVNNKIFHSSILWIVLIEVVGQFYILSDRYFLSIVDEGGIAAINYASTIFLLPISIITLSFSTAILPKFSQLAAEHSYLELKEKLCTAMINVSLMFIPVSLIFIFWGREIVMIFFERGNFSASSTELTYEVLFYLSISLLFYSLYSILNKLFYVFDIVRTLFIITLIGIAVKVSLNFILVEPFKQNGLAIATTVSYFVFFILSIIIIQFQNKVIQLDKISKKLIIYLINGLTSYLMVSAFFTAISSGSFFFDIIKIILFFLIYFINNQLLNDKYQLALHNEILKVLSIKIFKKET